MTRASIDPSPTSDRAAIEEAARRLHQAYGSRPCDPVRTLLRERDIGGAYAIQEANTIRWLQEGRQLSGRKIGLTAKAVQIASGIDQPDYGMLFGDMELVGGETLPAGTLIQPKAEVEVAFVLERDLTEEAPTLTRVIDAVAYALPALEIVDTRIKDWDLQIVDTIADNAAAGRYVLGARPVSIRDVDLLLCGAVIEKNGDAVSFGAGIACLGHPLHAVRWLARTMVRVGRPLRAGDVVLSGALGPMVAAEPGDHIEARISGLGAVDITFGR